jgi:hypothetical protein
MARPVAIIAGLLLGGVLGLALEHLPVPSLVQALGAALAGCLTTSLIVSLCR